MQQAPRTHPTTASIIINNFNYERFAARAIESALAQTHPAQVIVVDDASTDGSREVIANFGERIVPVYLPANGGQSFAINAGFEHATGDIVLLLDSDDMLKSDAVATLLRDWRDGTVMAQYPLTIVDVRGEHQGLLPDPPTMLSDGDVRDELVRTGSFCANVTSGLAFHRATLAKVMPMPERVFRSPADGYLVRAVGFLGPVQRFDRPLAVYRMHDRNDSDVSADSGGLAAGFRKKIRYAQSELETTRQVAASHGIVVPADLGARDADYLGYRLASLLLDPASHPVTGDRRSSLLWAYLRARWTSSWPVYRRLFAMLLVAVAAVAPDRTAGTCLRWLNKPASRPRWMRALAHVRRRRRYMRPASEEDASPRA